MWLYYNILCRPPGSNSVKWFKFDDGEVTEAKIDDEEVCTVASAIIYVLCNTVCCIDAGVQGTVLWWRIHWRSVRSCAKKVGCLVHQSDQCYPSYFRTHYRRQKRWWSAYLLFFDRLDQEKVFDGKVILTLQMIKLKVFFF